MDTIKPGYRLIPISIRSLEATAINPPPNAYARIFPPKPPSEARGWSTSACNRFEAEAKNLQANIKVMLARYNRLLRRLPRAARARSDLLQLSLLLHDSAAVAVVTPPSVPVRTRETQRLPSRADLRLEARRNGVSLPVLWERFPPESLAEKKQMTEELGRYWQRQRPQLPAGDGFTEYLRRQAKELAKARGDKTLYQRLLADADWKAKQKADYDSITNIDLGDLL